MYLEVFHCLLCAQPRCQSLRALFYCSLLETRHVSRYLGLVSLKVGNIQHGSGKKDRTIRKPPTRYTEHATEIEEGHEMPHPQISAMRFFSLVHNMAYAAAVA